MTDRNRITCGFLLAVSLCSEIWGQAAPVAVEAQPVASQTTTPVNTPKVDPAHPLAKALEKAYSSREALRELKDYEALFSKKELIKRKLVSQVMQIKVREEPFSVYLRFEKPYEEGREVIYVAGRNGGKLQVHEAGFKALAGTMSLAPTDNLAMNDNHYPITKIGMKNLLEDVITQWEAEAKFGECEVNFFPEAKIGDVRSGEVQCLAIECKHPTPRNQFKFHRTMLYIDKQTNLPFRIENYGFPAKNKREPELIEEYTYTRIRTNVGLTDTDFDVRNPKYQFGGK